MFTKIENGVLTVVVNGCSDCPFKIVATPNHKCLLLNREFRMEETTNYNTKRLGNCPLPIATLFKVVAHAYSSRTKET